MLEVLECFCGFCSPLEFILSLQELEEGYAPFAKPGQESIQGCHAAYNLLDVLDGSWGVHGHDGIDLLWVSFNSSVADDESEWFSRGYSKDALGWVELPAEFSEAVESLFQVSNELILGLCFDNDVVNIGFNIAMQLIGEAQLYRTLVDSASILQPKGHGFVGVCPVRGDEGRPDLVFFF